MNAFRIVGIALIIAGTLGLSYGSFSYTQESHDVKLGPIEFAVKEKKSVNVPQWASIGAIALGALFLLKRS